MHTHSTCTLTPSHTHLGGVEDGGARAGGEGDQQITHVNPLPQEDPGHRRSPRGQQQTSGGGQGEVEREASAGEGGVAGRDAEGDRVAACVKQ